MEDKANKASTSTQLDGTSSEADLVTKKVRKRTVAAKGRKVKRKKTVLEEKEVETFLKGMSPDFDSVLEETAQKNQLTAINVKNILRHVITNKDVLTMVWNTMRSDEANDNTMESEMSAMYEQKLTRSKVRKLCGTDAATALNVNPSASDDNPTKKLLEEEFSESESSDEEYHPQIQSSVADDETDEEIGSPDYLRKNATQNSTSITPVPFEELSEESSLHIAEEDSSVDEDKIALRTRSKLPLTDTLLESIEAAFVAPDITTDMYDSECDDEDWQSFLGDLLKASTVTAETEDDDQLDPEYNFLAEEDKIDTWDLRNDRAVKVSKKELNDLVAELIEFTDQDCASPEEEETDKCVRPKHVQVLQNTIDQNADQKQADVHSLATVPQLITMEVREILDEQMRMHVQLLAQMYVLCLMEPSFQTYRHSAEILLFELKRFVDASVMTGQKSAFAAANLSEAVDLVAMNMHISSCKNSSEILPKSPRSSKIKFTLKEVPKFAQTLIANSKAFVYPELLPLHAFLIYPEKPKVTFITAEDHLVALGLEQFVPPMKGFQHIELLQKYLLTTKTEQQIRIHIKNLKRIKVIDTKPNPIKYYLEHGKAPPVEHIVQPFNENNMVAPCYWIHDPVPSWLKKHFKYKKSSYVIISPAINEKPRTVKPNLNASSTPLNVRKAANSSPPRARCNLILPRFDVHVPHSPKNVSPLKQITPILRKYRSGRGLSRGPIRLSFSPTTKVTSDGTYNRPLAPKIVPTLVSHSNAVADKLQVTAPSPSRKSQQKGSTRNSNGTYRPLAPKIVSTPVSHSNTVADKLQVTAPSTSGKAQQKGSATAAETNVKSSITEMVASGHTKGNKVNLEKNASVKKSVTSQEKLVQRHNSKNGKSVMKVVQKKTENSLPNSGTEAVEESDDVDNEVDLEALMLSSSTICKKQHSVIKKKNKQQRELETSLALLAPDILDSDPLRDTRLNYFARSFLEKVRDILTDDVARYGIFLQTLSEFDGSSKSVKQLFDDMKCIFSDHPHVLNEFSLFLTPEQAYECGKLEDNMDFLKYQSFLRKMEVYQPNQVQKFLKVLIQLQKNPSLTSEAVFSAVQPFMRNQNHLTEEFSRFFLSEAPPDSMMMDFEEFTVPDSDCEINTDDEMVEEFIMPDSEDLYGTKKCPCKCHTDTTDLRMQSCNRHCVQCGIKFIDGRIFLQHGKGLKPAQVIYHDEIKPEEPSTASPTSFNPGTDHAASSREEEDISKEKTAIPPSVTFADCVRMENMGNTIATCSNICGIETLNVALPSTSSDLYLHNIHEEDTVVEIYDPFALAVQHVMNEEGPAKEIAEQYGLSFSNPCRVPWTKDEDKCLLETCQKFGATDTAFTEVTTALTGRMLEDVKHRFLELMSLFTVHGNTCTNDIDDSD